MPATTPPAPPVLAALRDSAITRDLVARLQSERHVAVTGQWGSCALLLAACVQQITGRPMLIITAHLDEADDGLDQLQFFRPDLAANGTAVYPAYEVLPG